MLSNFYAEKRLGEIDVRINELEETMRALPNGRLHVSTCKKRTQYYQVTGTRGSADFSKKYLAASKRHIAIALAKKELIKAEVADLLAEKASLEAMLACLEKLPSNISLERIRSGNKKFLELIREAQYENISWANAPYSSSAPNQEARRVRAIDGTMVRSKSEAVIISLLVKYNIPYRYECDLFYNGKIIGCPDFTIMHPATHEIILWEHFGRMDDSNYVRRNIYKIQSYIESGYYPMINFIITGETADKPFDITLADSLIRQFLLQ